MKKKVSIIITFSILILILLLWKNKKECIQPKPDCREIELSGTEVLECSKDIEEGYYDIHVVEGPTNVGLHAMDQGEYFHNYHIKKNSSLFLVGGKGKIKILPSERKMKKGKIFNIWKMGEYEVGIDIEEGEYLITLQSELKQDNRIVIYVWDHKEEQCIETYSFQSTQDSTTVKLKKGQYLWVSRTVEEKDKKSEIKLEFQRYRK